MVTKIESEIERKIYETLAEECEKYVGKGHPLAGRLAKKVVEALREPITVEDLPGPDSTLQFLGVISVAGASCDTFEEALQNLKGRLLLQAKDNFPDAVAIYNLNWYQYSWNGYATRRDSFRFEGSASVYGRKK